MSALKQLNDAINFVNNAHEELLKGNVVVLEGFQDNIRNICDDIAKLPQAEMDKHKDKLEILAESLQVLEVELRQQQANVQHEIINLNKKQKALKTYEQTKHSGKKDSDGDS